MTRVQCRASPPLPCPPAGAEGGQQAQLSWQQRAGCTGEVMAQAPSVDRQPAASPRPSSSSASYACNLRHFQATHHLADLVQHEALADDHQAHPALPANLKHPGAPAPEGRRQGRRGWGRQRCAAPSTPRRQERGAHLHCALVPGALSRPAAGQLPPLPTKPSHAPLNPTSRPTSSPCNARTGRTGCSASRRPRWQACAR